MSLNSKLSEILVRDPETNLLSQDKIVKGTQIIEKNITQFAEKARQGRNIIEVIQIKTGQITTYKQKDAEALYRTKDGKFKRVEAGTTSVPLEPYLIKISTPIPNSLIEDQVPVYFYDSVGRGLAVKEDNDIVETISEAADVTIDASTPGNLTIKDITSAKQKIEFLRQPALIAHPMDMADLYKDIRKPFEDVCKLLGIKIMRAHIPLQEGTALVFDSQGLSVALFERRPITARLFDDPLKDCVDIIVTQRYVPIVLDCSKVVKITNC